MRPFTFIQQVISSKKESYEIVSSDMNQSVQLQTRTSEVDQLLTVAFHQIQVFFHNA